MGKSVEVLLSAMDMLNEADYQKIIEKNKMTGQVVTVNQVRTHNQVFNIKEGKKRLYTYNEKGASRSRNRLLEHANGDICAFADDDTIYEDNYEKIIRQEYEKNPKADAIMFFIENENKSREKNKKLGNRKLRIVDAMRVRTAEMTIKKETIQKLKEKNIEFDENFGPGSIFEKGDETILVSDMIKNGFKVYGSNKKIGIAQHLTSTWFKGYNEKFLYNQGAIFYRIAPKMYKLLIMQYIIRKYPLYRSNVSIIGAYKQMNLGVQKAKQISERKNYE